MENSCTTSISLLLGIFSNKNVVLSLYSQKYEELWVWADDLSNGLGCLYSTNYDQTFQIKE